MTTSASFNNYRANRSWMRADWNAQNQTEVAESIPGNSSINNSAKCFPISLLLISWSFTKEDEQITLRLYLWAFLILCYFYSNTNSSEKDSILQAAQRSIYFRNFEMFAALTILKRWIFYCTCLKASQKSSLISSYFLKTWSKSEKLKVGWDIKSYLLHQRWYHDEKFI